MTTEQKSWEDMIAINTRAESASDALPAAAEYFSEESIVGKHKHLVPIVSDYLELDKQPLPTRVDREGYYGDNHLGYWMSGLHDYLEARALLGGKVLNRYMDFGAATGRVCRHFAAYEPDIEVICADINLAHVNWVNKHLARNVSAFQNSSIPHLPFEDNSFDLITAYSVFSHIEVFDNAWLYEIRRILKPGGHFLFTANVDNWQCINEKWPVYKALINHPEFSEDMLGKPLPTDRKVFRWNNSGSYSANVFMTSDYVHNSWGRVMNVDEIIPFYTGNQTGVLMSKKES